MPRRPRTSDDTAVADVFRRQGRRLDKLEMPDGNQLGQALLKVNNLITNIGSYVTAFLAGGFTAASANITGSGTIATLFATNAPGTVHTGTRVAGWWLSANGLAGTATSSERFKQDITNVMDDPGFDAFAVLDLQVKYWRYIAEIRKRDDPGFDGYVGPDYHVAVNFGPIAEDAHALGLWMIVVYEREYVPGQEPVLGDDGSIVRDGVQRLKLDASGEPIPFALHDSLFAYLLQLAVQRMRQEQLADRALLDAVASKVGVERSRPRW